MTDDRNRFTVGRAAPQQQDAILVQKIQVDGFEFDFTDDPHVLEPGDRFIIANRVGEGITLDIDKAIKRLHLGQP